MNQVKKWKTMFDAPRFASIVVGAALSAMLFSSIAHATPMSTASDKNYEIVLVTEECYGNTDCEDRVTMTFDSLLELFENHPDSPYNVTWMPAQDFYYYYINSSARDITAFDLLVWQTEYDWLFSQIRAEEIAAAIRKSGIPTVLMDGPGFPLSKVTELIPDPQTVNGTTYPDAELNPLGRNNLGIGTEWHPLAPFGIDNSEGFSGGADGDDLWISVSGYTHTVNLPDLFTAEGGKYRFTRPVWSANEFALEEYSLNDVAFLVDDRRHVIATGVRYPIYDWGYICHFFPEGSMNCDPLRAYPSRCIDI